MNASDLDAFPPVDLSAANEVLRRRNQWTDFLRHRRDEIVAKRKALADWADKESRSQREFFLALAALGEAVREGEDALDAVARVLSKKTLDPFRGPGERKSGRARDAGIQSKETWVP